MAKRNQVQFQKGMSLSTFLQLYGTEEKCAEALAKRKRANCDVARFPYFAGFSQRPSDRRRGIGLRSRGPRPSDRRRIDPSTASA